jgi:hypothetical protein
VGVGAGVGVGQMATLCMCMMRVGMLTKHNENLALVD